MRKRRMLCLLFACLVLVSNSHNAYALDVNDAKTGTVLIPYASGRFSLSVNGNSFATASSTFNLAKGEVVTITANYLPADASVDCGIVDEDGTFYYVNSTNGSIDKSITVKANGTYTFTVRNNSSGRIDITGIVSY